eukprot:CAMPEP_0201110714 /NCGR_PEP_ID=MMETSP0812-20130820/71724_1 /ASSEMBLY_ACC=CAM_ASM_000668 /TAXON_ID=98059 /ORGANISM="Dinobryon sp., Strain UTEXLB2267" /LENGTH=64 /DNA_ID=CAMNT_0047373323 /DNA_START=39 /DNA_END=233 /DNA_ORIENTATION=-
MVKSSDPTSTRMALDLARSMVSGFNDKIADNSAKTASKMAPKVALDALKLGNTELQPKVTLKSV